jgi:L-rhamnose isomerase
VFVRRFDKKVTKIVRSKTIDVSDCKKTTNMGNENMLTSLVVSALQTTADLKRLQQRDTATKIVVKSEQKLWPENAAKKIVFFKKKCNHTCSRLSRILQTNQRQRLRS